MKEQFPALSGLKCRRHFFAPSSLYLQAHTADGKTTLLWMEEKRFGVPCAFPCVVEREGELLVFWYGDDLHNERLHDWWSALTAESLRRDYNVAQLSKKEFIEAFREYREKESSACEEADAAERQ